MDKAVIAMISMFSYEHPVVLIEENGEGKEYCKTTIDELPEILLGLCETEDTYNIELIGQSQYTEQIANEIEEISNTKYAHLPLNINIREI